jgi:hypothetical protein
MKTRRILHQAQEDPTKDLCFHLPAQHSTAKMRNEMSFSWDLWLKGKLKNSHINDKEND